MAFPHKHDQIFERVLCCATDFSIDTVYDPLCHVSSLINIHFLDAANNFTFAVLPKPHIISMCGQ